MRKIQSLGNDLGERPHKLLKYVLSYKMNAIDLLITFHFPVVPSIHCLTSLCPCSWFWGTHNLCSIFNKNTNRYESGYFILKMIKSIFYFFEKKNVSKSKYIACKICNKCHAKKILRNYKKKMKTLAWWWRIRFAYKMNLGLILAILSLAIVSTEVRGLKKFKHQR